jgi:hypothetical protein
METLCREQEGIRAGIAQTVVANLKKMAQMGVYLEEHMQLRYPEFPVRGGIRSWEEYLPPLNADLCALAETSAA